MCRDITKEINFGEVPSGYIVGGKGGTPPRVWGRVLFPFWKQLHLFDTPTCVGKSTPPNYPELPDSSTNGQSNYSEFPNSSK